MMRRLFGGAPDEYDSLLSLLTLRRDSKWRRAVIAASAIPRDAAVLDLATGTGLTAFDFARELNGEGLVVGLDICVPMLRKGKENIRANGMRIIDFVAGAAESLPFVDGRFDCAAITLALRNVTDPRGTFEEMRRVVKHGGIVISLDFSRPANRRLRSIYRFHITRIMPSIGRLVSREWKEIFEYLAKSIMKSLAPAEIAELMQTVGLRDVKSRQLSMGVVTLVVGTKP